MKKLLKFSVVGIIILILGLTIPVKVLGQEESDYYATREEAVAHVPTHVVPKDCFVWKDGSDPNLPWRVIPGNGCAHWVAHELGLGIFPSPWHLYESGELEPPLPRDAWDVCFDGYYIRVNNVTAGRTEIEIKDAAIGDLWTIDYDNDGEEDHVGIVRQVGENEVFVEHDSSNQGGVVQDWMTNGTCWHLKATVSEYWNVSTNGWIWSTPAVGDINNDEKLEVVVGSWDYNLYALNGENGSECWVYQTGDRFYSSPSLGDIDGDGKLEVVIGDDEPYIYAINGEDGSELWIYETKQSSPLGVIYASPTLGDIDNDGKLEVVIGSYDHNLYALNGEDGSELWKRDIGASIDPSAALGDIDGDGKLEVVIGCYDHKIYAINGEDGSELWNYETGGPLRSSPSLGDIDCDGKLEVVVGSHDGILYALNGEDGSECWVFQTGISVQSCPALGDIDNDGKLEIVIGSGDHKIYAINGEDGSKIWNYTTGSMVWSSASLGDVDGDGKLEVVIGSYDHKIYAINCEDGSESWSFSTNDWVISTPVLADLDGDGKLEVIVGSRDKKIYALKPEPSGQEISWQGFSGDTDFNRRRCLANDTSLPPLDLDVLFSWSKTYWFEHIGNQLRISIIKSTQKNDNLLSSWHVIPDEGYNFEYGIFIELSNLNSTLEFYGAPTFITDFCNILLSEDGILRIFISLNTLIDFSHWTDDEMVSNLKTIIFTLIKLGLNPNSKVSVPASYRWLFENSIGEKYFHIVRGTNQYQLKLLPSAQKDPIWALIKILDICARIDFYILNINSQNVKPIRISSHDFIKAGKFIIDIWKLVTKCGRVIASAGGDMAAWIQGGASAYKIFHQVIFDPPSILESILNLIFPDYSTKIQEIFGEFEKISNWIYVGASFLDPPTSRLDLGVFDSNGKLLLGYNKTNGQLIYSSDIGFLVGDENGQFMFLNFSKVKSLNVSVINTDLNGYLDAPLNFTLIVKQINNDNIWVSGGTLLDNTTTSTLIENSDNNFTISTLYCKIIEDKYPNIKFQVVDINSNPIEVDNFELYLYEQQLSYESVYLGNGTYLIKNIQITYNQNDVLSLILEKKSYLMSLTEIILSNFPEAPYLTINTPSPTTSFEIEFSWTASQWASNYTLYRHTILINSSNLYSATEIKTVHDISTYDMVPGLDRWYYVVIANNATGSSNPSNCLYIDVQEEAIGGRDVIPGYNVIILIGTMGFISIVLIKKRRK